MIKLEHSEVFGWEAAIRGMRNPMNSWDKSDTKHGCDVLYDEPTYCIDCAELYDCSCKSWIIGPNDLALMKKLVNAGSDHSKFMRMINVSVDITAPLYWWKEYDTYKVGTVANSCSTMHKIHEKEFTAEDFSFEYVPNICSWHIESILNVLNTSRERYLETKNKNYWYTIIQLLPSSYNQRRTVQLNYAVLRNIYHARRNHKLTEWHTFCDFITQLPYSELITGVQPNPCTTST